MKTNLKRKEKAMKKIVSVIIGGMLGLTLATSVGVAVFAGNNVQFKEALAASKTITFSSQGYTNGSAATTVTSSPITISFDKGTNTTAPTYYSKGTAVRAYGGNTMTVATTASYLISQIKITFGSDDGSNAITTDIGTYSSGTWTGSSSSVTFTVGGTTGNRRLSSVAITYAANTNPTVTLDKEQVDLLSNNSSGVTVTASVINLTSPTYSWTTQDSNITLSNANTSAVTIVPNTDVSGTATVTLTVTKNQTTLTKTVAVTIIKQPYSVAEARAAIDADANITDVSTQGIIAQIDSYNSTYKSITYWISDDGTTTNMLQVYSGKGLNGADFTAVTDIEVGAIVIVKGTLKKYYSTYEYDTSSVQTSYTLKTITSISITGNMTNTLYVDGGLWSSKGFAVTATYSDNSTGDVTGAVTWSYNPAIPTIGVTSVTATATLDSFTASSSAQSVMVSNNPYLVGTAYKMYFYNTEKASNYYFTGAMATGTQQYYGAASPTKSEGVDVFFENKTGGGHNIYFTDSNNAKQYFSVTVTTTHHNFTFSTTEPTEPWLYDGNSVVYVVDGVNYSFGTKGSFTTFDAVITSQANNYLVQFETTTAITAEAFATSFLANMTCDGTGATAPTYASGYSWADFQVLFNQLDSTEQSSLQSATANESGTTVEQAMARYDYVVAKYGYSNFINRAVSNSSNRMMKIIDNNSVVILTVVTALLITSALAACYMLKKRKLD